MYRSYGDSSSRRRASKGSITGYVLGHPVREGKEYYREGRPKGTASGNRLEQAARWLAQRDAYPAMRDSSWQAHIPNEYMSYEELAIEATGPRGEITPRYTMSDIGDLKFFFADLYYEWEVFSVWKHLSGDKYGAGKECARLSSMCRRVSEEIARILLDTRRGSKSGRGIKEPVDSMDFDPRQSRAGVRGHQDRHPGGSGNGSRRGMAEADIASTTRDFSRLGFGSRESANMPSGIGFEDIADKEPTHRSRGSRHGVHPPSMGQARSSGRDPAPEMVPPSRHQDMNDSADIETTHRPRGSHHGGQPPSIGHGRASDYGDLEPTHQPLGSRHGGPPPSAGQDRSSGHHPGHGPGPQMHRDDVEESDFQPLGSGHGKTPPSAGQGRSSDRHSSLRPGRPSRRHDLESYSVEEPDFQPLRGNPTPSAGHGRHSGHRSGR